MKFMAFAALVAIASVPFVLMGGRKPARRWIHYRYPDNIFEDELSV